MATITSTKQDIINHDLVKRAIEDKAAIYVVCGQLHITITPKQLLKSMELDVPCYAVNVSLGTETATGKILFIQLLDPNH